MNIESTGMHSSSHLSKSQKSNVDQLKKQLDLYKEMAKPNDAKRQEFIRSLTDLMSTLQKDTHELNPTAFHAMVHKATTVLDNIQAIDSRFVVDKVEDVSREKGQSSIRSQVEQRVLEAEAAAAVQFLAIHQAKGTVSVSRSQSEDPRDIGHGHPSLNFVDVDEGIEDRLDLGEISAFVTKQHIALENAGVLPSIELDVDDDALEGLTLGSVIKLSMQLREARAGACADDGEIKVKGFYSAGAHMMDLIVGLLGTDDAEEQIMALLNKPFLSDEDILLIMDLLGDLGFSAPPGLLDKVKDALSQYLESAAMNASGPSDFLMIAEVVKSIGDSSLGDMFDENKLMSILEGQFQGAESATSIEEMVDQVEALDEKEDVDPNVDTSLQSLGSQSLTADAVPVVGSPDNPVDVNILEQANALHLQQSKFEAKELRKALQDDNKKIEALEKAEQGSFVYNFSESITKVIERFIEKELDMTLENFAFDTNAEAAGG